MARRDSIVSSLFPFLSVLACTIGVLVVLLAVMSLASVSVTEEARESWQERDRERAEDRARLDDSKREVAAAEARWRALDEALAERGATPGASAFEIRRWLKQARRQADTAARIAALESEQAELERERGEVETTIAVLESRRETLPILIDPTGLSRRWKPWFVACEAEGLTAYRVRDGHAHFVSQDSISMQGELGRYLRRLLAEPGALLVLLVRPDGLGVAGRLARLAKGVGIRVARLPLPGTGELDWSLMRRAEGRAGGSD